jgi:hypothetical protein
MNHAVIAICLSQIDARSAAGRWTDLNVKLAPLDWKLRDLYVSENILYIHLGMRQLDRYSADTAN